ncbi:MAG: TraR/DksA family transcriptional regulator [Ilumatobacteraceae bacterium]
MAVKKSVAKKTAAKKAVKPAAPKKKAAKKVAKPAAKKAAPKKSVAKPAAKKAVAKKAVKPAAKKAAAPKKSVAKPAARKVTAKPVAQKAVPKKAVKPVAPTKVVPEFPKPRGVSKDGIAYTKEFDVRFLKAQRELLLEERERLVGQADRLEHDAQELIDEAEMGDVQFDDEGGEGDTMVVERERDLALSAQAREAVAEIDAALERITSGRYGFSLVSARPIPRERLEAIPWATELVEEKVGGIGR